VHVAEPVPTHADVEGQPGGCLEIVGPVKSQPLLQGSQRRLALGGLRRVGKAQHKRGEGVGDAGYVAGESQLAPRHVRTRAARYVVAVFAAEFDVVPAPVYENAVGNLVQPHIVQLPRFPGIGEAKVARDRDNRQAVFVGLERPSVHQKVQPERLLVEAVRGERPTVFSVCAVIAVAQIVHQGWGQNFGPAESDILRTVIGQGRAGDRERAAGGGRIHQDVVHEYPVVDAEAVIEPGQILVTVDVERVGAE